MSSFAALLLRDLRLVWRQPGDSLTVLVFFVLVATLFVLGAGPDPTLLARIGAGVIWVGALFAALLSFDRLFQADAEDGSLDQMLLAPLPAQAVALARCLAHWLTTGLPLTLVSPLLALLLGLPAHGLPVLAASLLLGTALLSLLGALGAALVVGARRGGVLVPLLILPLCVPALIFGVAAVEAAAAGGSAEFPLTMLAALFLAALGLAPWGIAAALRLAAE